MIPLLRGRMLGVEAPFPGMDPWLERPAPWPDVHNRLVTAVADEITPLIAPRYYVALERRTYVLRPDELVLVERPDVSVVSDEATRPPARRPRAEAFVVEVTVPVLEEVGEVLLEVHATPTRDVITVLELLSPANKLHACGRLEFERKREAIFGIRTSLVEIDLLRAGVPMPLAERVPPTDYRILVSPGYTRPKARFHAFDLRDAIPSFRLPLLLGDEELEVPLGEILRRVYGRARFDLQIDYSRPPVPPLSDDDAPWAAERIAAWRARANA